MRGNLILIEDNEEMRRTLAGLLRGQGFEVRESGNGRDGYHQILESPPDVIISDVQMPEWSGPQMLEALRADARTALIPVIFLTGWADRASVRQGMELGAVDYITKPFELEELMKALEVQLAKEAVRKEREQRAAEEAQVAVVRRLPHELLTPLNGILGPADLLASGEIKNWDEVAEMGAMMLLSAKRLKHSMENLLLFISQVKSPEMRPAPTITTDARSILESHLENELGDDARKRVRLSGTTEALAVDREDFLVVAGELMDNALKFSPRDSLVEVTLGNGSGEATLVVLDQGRGMTEEQIAGIGPFVQHEKERYEQQGLGLGLTVARAVLENRGGRLSITSQPGGPTVAAAYFPCAKS